MTTHMVRQHFAHLAFPRSQHMVKSRKWGKNEGLGCNLIEPCWIAPRSSEKVIRLGERGAVCLLGSLGCLCVSSLQRQNVCLWRLQVNCSWGTKRRKSHHRKLRDYRLLNAGDYTFRPPPRTRRMQMSTWIKKKKKQERWQKKRRKNPFVTYLEGRKHKFSG